MDRRLPCVTYVLVLLCILGFFYAKIEAVEVEAVVDTELDAAARTLREHPYLRLPRLLGKRITPEQAARMPERFSAEEGFLSTLGRHEWLVIARMMLLRTHTQRRRMQRLMSNTPRW